MRRATSFLLGLAASLVLGSSPSVFADVIYSQPSNFPVANDVGVWSSQTDQFGNFSEAYDNFTLSSTENILSVNWQGGYFFPPVQGPIDGFQISFYADVGGQPGASPLSTNFVSGTANETFVGVEPGTAEWGRMIAEARSHMRSYPRLVLAPGLSIMAFVVAVNLLGDALGDRWRVDQALALTPKKGRSA